MLSFIPYFDNYVYIIVLSVSHSNIEFRQCYRKFCTKIQTSSLVIGKCRGKGKFPVYVYCIKNFLKTPEIKKIARSAERICLSSHNKEDMLQV